MLKRKYCKWCPRSVVCLMGGYSYPNKVRTQNTDTGYTVIECSCGYGLQFFDDWYFTFKIPLEAVHEPAL